MRKGEKMDKNRRRIIFREELSEMNRKGFLTDEEYNVTKSAHESFIVHEDEVLKPNKKSKPVKEKKPKKILSEEEIKERNITWALFSGVILILLSGLFLATSNWDIMSNIMKTILISGIAGLFFAMSLVADKILRVRKSAFAFWILGSLFFPVAILSAGYFKLFGPWLSIFGEGKYLLGVIGATLSLPLYVYSSTKYKNRLFIWFGLITLTIDIIFILSFIKLPKDIFYLSIVIYNGLLLYLHSRFKKVSKISLFIKELPSFIQVNMIITTLFVLSFYDNSVLYGFNILLTAILYIAVTFVYDKKEYTFVFGGLVVYGLYQVITNTFLASIDLILFSMISIIFLGMDKYLTKDENLKKIFKYMGAFVSFCAFIFISLKSLSFVFEDSSRSPWIMFIAYSIVALNYLYLSNTTKRKIFAYLTPIFMVIAEYQGFRILERIFLSYEHLPIYMFSVGMILFFGYYAKVFSPFLKPIRISSGIISILVMTFSILSVIALEWHGYLIIMTFLFGLVLYFIYTKSDIKLKLIKEIASWIMPILWLISLMAIYSKFYIIIHNAFNLYDSSIHSLLSLIVLLGIGHIWLKANNKLFKRFFWVSQVLMPLTTLALLFEGHFSPILYMIILAFYSYGVIRSNKEWQIRLFSYMAFTNMPLLVFSLIDAFVSRKSIIGSMLYDYILIISIVTIWILWFIAKGQWQKRISHYLIPASVISGFITIMILTGLSYFNPFSYNLYDFIIMTLYIIGILYMYHREGFHILKLLPLGVYALSVQSFVVYLSRYGNYTNSLKLNLIALHIVLFLILKFTGQILYKKLYEFKKINNLKDSFKVISIDWYFVFSIYFLIRLSEVINYDSMLIVKLIPSTLFLYLMFSQIKRVKEGLIRKITITITGLSFLIPYYQLVDHILVKDFLNKAPFLETELIILPYLILVIILGKRVWQDKKIIINRIELSILIISSGLLLKDILVLNYLTDAILLGILSLISFIVGMNNKKKSYFFVGLGTLFINVLIETKSLWGNLPWWTYLLITGLILVTIATINEIQKNNKDKESKNKFDKEKILSKFKNWN